MKKLLKLLALFALGMAAGAASAQIQAQDVTLTGTIQGANGLPAANTVLNFTPTQTFFVPGTNTTQQVGNIYASTPPSGACAVSGQFYTNAAASPMAIYQCQYGVWVGITSFANYGFGSITSGTNSIAAMVVGTGASLSASGGGTIAATALNGVAVSGSPSAGEALIATGGSAATWQAVESTSLPSTPCLVYGLTSSSSRCATVADVTALGPLSNNTTGTAAYASQLAAAPTVCSGGMVATGILANGNPASCVTASGSAPTGPQNALSGFTGAGSGSSYALGSTSLSRGASGIENLPDEFFAGEALGWMDASQYADGENTRFQTLLSNGSNAVVLGNPNLDSADRPYYIVNGYQMYGTNGQYPGTGTLGIDTRSGGFATVSTDPTPSSLSSPGYAAGPTCITTPDASSSVKCAGQTYFDLASGYNQYAQWNSPQLNNQYFYSASSGIHVINSTEIHDYGVGDFTLGQAVGDMKPGTTAAADEGGNTYGRVQINEAYPYRGVMVSTSALGTDTRLILSPSYNPDKLGTWHPVLDETYDVQSGTATLVSAGSTGVPAVVTTSFSVPVSHSCILATPVTGPTTTSYADYVSATFTCTVTGDLASTVGDKMAFEDGGAGTYDTDAVVTAVGTLSGSSQSVTANVRFSHASGEQAWIGGAAGRWLDDIDLDVQVNIDGTLTYVGTPAAWVSGTAYTGGDFVSYSGQSYIAIASSTGQTPSSSPSYWAQTYTMRYPPDVYGSPTANTLRVGFEGPGAMNISPNWRVSSANVQLFHGAHAVLVHGVVGTDNQLTSDGKTLDVAGNEAGAFATGDQVEEQGTASQSWNAVANSTTVYDPYATPYGPWWQINATGGYVPEEVNPPWGLRITSKSPDGVYNAFEYDGYSAVGLGLNYWPSGALMGVGALGTQTTNCYEEPSEHNCAKIIGGTFGSDPLGLMQYDPNSGAVSLDALFAESLTVNSGNSANTAFFTSTASSPSAQEAPIVTIAQNSGYPVDPLFFSGLYAGNDGDTFSTAPALELNGDGGPNNDPRWTLGWGVSDGSMVLGYGPAFVGGNPQTFSSIALHITQAGVVTVPTFIDSSLTAGTSLVCPNGTGGALTTSGCSGGSGIPTTPTNALVKINGTNGAASGLVDNGTSLTYTPTSGTDTAYRALVGNVTTPSVVANSVGWMAPASASFTGYALQLPTTNPSSASPVLNCGAPSSGISSCTWAAAIANIQITIGGSVSFAANTCSSYTGTASTASATTMTGLTTSMTITHTPTTDISAVTGWSPGSGGQLYFTSYPTAGSLNDYVCNSTSAAIVTGGSVTWNVSAK